MHQVSRSLGAGLWRGATTIFMTSGWAGAVLTAWPGGAPAGFDAEIWVNDPGVQMIDSVRSAGKKRLWALVQADMEAEIREIGIPVNFDVLDDAALEAAFDRGAVRSC